MNRLEREQQVIECMIRLYCRRHHKERFDNTGLCEECRELLDYCHTRLIHCPKGSAKRSCRKCDIHCYAPDKREKIRMVMRYVGPRMLFIHPFDAILHLISEMK